MGPPWILGLESNKEDNMIQNPLVLAQIIDFYPFKFKFGEKFRLKDSQIIAYSVREYQWNPYEKKVPKKAWNIWL